MTTKEMMIGDFYRVNRDGICIPKGSIVEVRAIDADNKLDEKGLVGSAYCHPLDEERFEFDGGIWCDFLDPIPLTPEILEKNGFGYIEKDENLSHYYLGELLFCKDMNLHIGTDNTGRFWLNYYNNAIYGLRYVHQLQHALRICGIGKNIEL